MKSEQKFGFTRAFLALSLTLYFFLIIILTLYLGAFSNLEMTEAIEVITIIAPVLSGLIGAIIGYYFGSEQRET
jgi:uncharacterized membrane protein